MSICQRVLGVGTPGRYRSLVRAPPTTLEHRETGLLLRNLAQVTRLGTPYYFPYIPIMVT